MSNINGKIAAKHIAFYRIFGGSGLLISKAKVGGAYLSIANDGSSLIHEPDLKFPSSKSNRTDLDKWHLISVTWSNKGENLSNCWSNGEMLVTFTTGNVKGSDYIGNIGKVSGWHKTHLTGFIGEIIPFHKKLNDEKSFYIHEYLMRKWGITDTIISYYRGISQLYRTFDNHVGIIPWIVPVIIEPISLSIDCKVVFNTNIELYDRVVGLSFTIYHMNYGS